MKLGKLAPKHNCHALHLPMYMASVPPAPMNHDWTPAVTQPWGMMENDQLGDCTCAGMGHAEQLWTANTGSMFTPSDSAVLKAYEDVGGYVPGNPNTDNGASEFDVLKYWQNTGIAGKKILTYADINPMLLDNIKQAVWLFGVGYIGVAMPLTAQNQIGGIWDVVGDGATGNNAPGSWGGHCVDIVAYTPDELLCVTWGQLQRMTYKWFTTYCDEFHVPLSSDWINAKGVAASGFDLPTLQKDLNIIG